LAWTVAGFPLFVGAGTAVETGFIRITGVRDAEAVGETGLIVVAAGRDERIRVTGCVATGGLAVREEAF
jgi:hypothetical protein